MREPLFLDGTLQTADGVGSPNLVTYPITCGAAATMQVSATGVARLNLNAPVPGGAMRKTGHGVLLHSCDFANDLQTGITVAEGKMEVTGAAGIANLSAATTVGTDTTSVVVEIDEGDLVAPDPVLAVNPGSTVAARFAAIDLRGGTLSGRVVRFTGPLRVLASNPASVISSAVQLSSGGHVWNVENGAAAVDLQVTGTIFDDRVFPGPPIVSVLEKTGPGRVDFLNPQSGGNPDALRIFSGHCRWDGNSPDMLVDISGGTFSGTPVIGTHTGRSGIL